MLRSEANRRINAGEKAPQKVNDARYGVVNCDPRPRLSDNVYAMQVSSLTTRGYWVLCGNTKAGKEIIKRRNWYCLGEDESCVLSEWENGEPTFGDINITKDTINRGDVEVIAHFKFDMRCLTDENFV